MRIVGEQRLAGLRMRAGERPAVGAEARRGLRGHGGGQRREIDIDGVERGRTRVQRRQGIVRMLGPEVLELRRIQPSGEARPQHLVAEIVAEVPGHHLEPDQAVGRTPGLGLVAEQQELRRQQAGAGLQIGVHTRRVGRVDRLRLRRERLDIALGDPVDAERAQEPVGLEAGLAHHLRQPRLADPALHLQLPEPVLRVHVAHGEGAVPGRLRVDVRDRMGVAHDLHRRVEARDRLGPVIGGEREPGAGAHGQQQREQHKGADASAIGPEPPEPGAPARGPARSRGAHCASPSRIAARCSSSAGAGGRSGGSA